MNLRSLAWSLRIRRLFVMRQYEGGTRRINRRSMMQDLRMMRIFKIPISKYPELVWIQGSFGMGPVICNWPGPAKQKYFLNAKHSSFAVDAPIRWSSKRRGICVVNYRTKVDRHTVVRGTINKEW